MICITKTGQLITRTSKQVKATPITAEQYLLHQLNKNTVDTVDDILKQFEKHTQQNMTHIHNEQVNKDTTENGTSDTQQNNMQVNTSKNSSPNQIAVKNEQKENPNYMLLHSNCEEPNENPTTCTDMEE